MLLIHQKHLAKFKFPLQNIHAILQFCWFSLSVNVTLKCEMLGVVPGGKKDD